VAPTVFLHVGVAKTGTTYLQRILWANRSTLRAAGLLYPGKKSGDQFAASLDLRAFQLEKFEQLRVKGMWDKVAAEVRSFGGNAVISHETLARCSSGDVRKVRDSFPDADLRVVLTARDLGRQVPAVWQETVKNRSTSSYDDFLTNIFLKPDSGASKFFWRPQDVAKVVHRWGRVMGTGNVTVVTVPPPGAPRDELWRRFATAIDLPAVDIEPPEAAGNVSLGPAEAELLRHVNAVLPDELPWLRYTRLVKRQFAERTLASRRGDRLAVPPQWHDAVQERASSIVDSLAGSGCRVVGDLADLTPLLPVGAVTGPGDLSSDQLLKVAAEVIRDEVILRPPPRPPKIDVPAVPAPAAAQSRGTRLRAMLERMSRRVRRGA
jgi:hypothetical protein